MKNLTEQEWDASINADENSVIIDVRTPQEWSEGVIENALLLNIFETTDFVEAITKLDVNKNYYIYCRSGARSSQACQVFNNNGIASTYNLIGGIMSWRGKKVKGVI